MRREHRGEIRCPHREHCFNDIIYCAKTQPFFAPIFIFIHIMHISQPALPPIIQARRISRSMCSANAPAMFTPVTRSASLNRALELTSQMYGSPRSSRMSTPQ